MSGLRAHDRVGHLQRRRLREAPAPLQPPGVPGGVPGREQPAGARAGVGAQGGRALQRVRGGRVARPPRGAGGRRLERRRRVLVGADGRLRQVQGALLQVANRVEGARQGAMGIAPPGGRGQLQDHRPQHRVAQHGHAVLDRHEPGVLGGHEVLAAAAERRQGREHLRHGGVEADRDDDQRPTRARVERLEAAPERPGDRIAGTQRAGQRPPPRPLLVVHRARELHQRERAALGDLQHLARDGRRERRILARRRQQLLGGLRIEGGDHSSSAAGTWIRSGGRSREAARTAIGSSSMRRAQKARASWVGASSQ